MLHRRVRTDWRQSNRPLSRSNHQPSHPPPPLMDRTGKDAAGTNSNTGTSPSASGRRPSEQPSAAPFPSRCAHVSNVAAAAAWLAPHASACLFSTPGGQLCALPSVTVSTALGLVACGMCATAAKGLPGALATRWSPEATMKEGSDETTADSRRVGNMEARRHRGPVRLSGRLSVRRARERARGYRQRPWVGGSRREGMGRSFITCFEVDLVRLHLFKLDMGSAMLQRHQDNGKHKARLGFNHTGPDTTPI